MAKIICTEKESSKISAVLSQHPELFKILNIQWEIVECLKEIPQDYRYDTETDKFYVYRNKYTGNEIHIEKDPKHYILEEERGNNMTIYLITILTIFLTTTILIGIHCFRDAMKNNEINHQVIINGNNNIVSKNSVTINNSGVKYPHLH